MTGLYIHIPFCKSRCIYCAFYSTTHLGLRDQYVDALCREMTMRPTSDAVSTIYLGGGTPSQLTIAQLRRLIDVLYNNYKVEDNAEVTLECNPDDVTTAFAEALSSLPVNRISMGVQTFDDKRLRFLRRRHTSQQVPMAIERLQKVGISNISIDLMYGFPNEDIDDWLYDVDAALRLDVKHLSAYCLMVEEGTPLYEKMRKEKPGLANGDEEAEDDHAEELERQMYYTLIERLAAAGYEHYEISNFARPGFRSRHNSSYWTDIPYIGLGAAAHSYDGRCRRWNVSHLQQYMDAINNGQLTYQEEVLDDNTRYNDRIMLSLRTVEGIDVSKLSETERNYLLPLSQKFIDRGLLVFDSGRLRLSKEGLFVSDMVISDLMQV